MSQVDVDTLMREAGERWRRAQPGGHGYDVRALVFAGRPRGTRRLTVLAAALAVASVIAVVFLSVQTLTSAPGPVGPAAPVATPASIDRGQLIGTWYSSVSVTEARRTYHALVGDWILTFLGDGTVRVSGPPGTHEGSGHWELVGTTVTLDLPFAGCSTAESGYLADTPVLHGGLELASIDGQESCEARSLVIGGHWSASANPGG